MLWQIEMHWGIVFRFSICICVMGFAAAKCDPEICGSMTVSYPFWINNSECGYPDFRIKCKKINGTGMMAPLFRAYRGDFTQKRLPPQDYKIMKIDYTGYLIMNSTSLKAQSCMSNSSKSSFFQPPNGGPFTISMSNKFVVIGCKTFGTYAYGNMGDVRCVSLCREQLDPPYCRYGCCEVSVPDNLRWLNSTGGGVFSLRNSSTNVMDLKCGFSTIMDPSTFRVVDNETTLFWGEGRKADYGLRLNWGIGLQNCSMAKGTANYSCSIKAECIDSPSDRGHVCRCLPGYEGNGYSNGTDCTDINECHDEKMNLCVEEKEGGICHNSAGSYNCSCAQGYEGDGFNNGTRCASPQISSTLKYGIIGSVSSFVVVALGACGLFWCLRRRRLNRAKERNFVQNGGLLLQERIASMGGRKGLRIFSEAELQIASKNYSMELGMGGFATVYKGVLVDGTPVAIKKPKSISDEFINEIIILSHINHRNVVKLLGCCMETQFPLLVYEFISNGTLHQHLHSGERRLSWQARRQIAIETAEAISYMHHQASQPIFHRDIKSSNILLDDTFTPKVADFGLSRLRPSEEQMHLSTIAVGTRGYVDPEFVRSSHYTDKSDVFSFGVVLVELLTGLTPLLSVEDSMCTLYDHFLSALKENRLAEILVPEIISNEENRGQMENMARLAKACLRVKTRERPSMREVVEELVWIRASTRQSLLHRDVSLMEHKPGPKQTRLNSYAFLNSCDSTSGDLYPFPPSVTTVSIEDPSTRLIQMEMRDKSGR